MRAAYLFDDGSLAGCAALCPLLKRLELLDVIVGVGGVKDCQRPCGGCASGAGLKTNRDKYRYKCQDNQLAHQSSHLAPSLLDHDCFIMTITAFTAILNFGRPGRSFVDEGLNHP